MRHRLFQRPEWAIADLEEAARVFFGRTVMIEPRAIQAMQTLTRRSAVESHAPISKRKANVGNPRTGNATHVFAGLRSCLPALSTALLGLGYNEVKTPNHIPTELVPLDLGQHPLWELEWNKVLVRCFAFRDENGYASLSETGLNVQSTGSLSILDLLNGVLTSDPSVNPDWKPGGATRRRQRQTNLVMRHIASSLGRHKKATWTNENNEIAAAISTTTHELLRSDIDPGLQQLAFWQQAGNVKVTPFAALGPFAMVDDQSGLTVASRVNVPQLNGYFSQSSLDELEWLINSEAREESFQSFFVQHPEYLTILGCYSNLHSQLILANDEGKLIPDFFLEKLDDSRFVDILDLKLPNRALVRPQKNRERFRSDVMEATAQLATYRDYFEDRSNRESFANSYGLHGYRPHAIVVMGRNSSFTSNHQRVRLESELPNWLTLTTYDDILERANQWRNYSIAR